ncbi:hypothetical protein H4219_001042 [Mycoemilia scoparia]|uniref:Major facilitator superfamily (MFS) profile domain-containing protein n=1 Tax=Mycoemilia scoparia TaxID=417184 RepID=A0A9W8DQT8_9FUNG|nr:hypothetical protein H4219_001042 [Mycoemilia scoparia]
MPIHSLPETRTQSVHNLNENDYYLSNTKKEALNYKENEAFDSQASSLPADPQNNNVDVEKTAGGHGDASQPTPPDGGYGWLVVFSGFSLLMFSLGITNAFGEYQKDYHIELFPDEPMSNIAWIGTLQFACMNLFGILVGILCERMDTRLVTFIGGVIMAVALIAASFIKAMWGLILTQGMLFGIGGSFCFIPPCSLPSQWFTKRRGLAIGLVVAGSGLGGLWITPATHAMIRNLGFDWALRISGILVFVVSSCASWFMRPFYPPKKRQTIIDFEVLKDIRFLLIFASAVCGFCAYYSPFFYLPTFAVIKDGKSESFGTNLIMSINAASTVGRIVTGFVADKIGRINALVICTLMAALSILILWLPFHVAGTMIAMTITYGLSCGGFVSLLPVIMADLFGVHRISNIIGLLYISYFTGSIIGAPAMGGIIDNIGHGTNFVPMIVYAGVFMLCSVILQVVLRFIVTKKFVAKV